MLIVCVPRNQVYTHTVQKMDINELKSPLGDPPHGESVSDNCPEPI
jgi:hypothetical protein